MLGQGKNGWNAYGQVKTTNVEDLCFLYQLPDLGRLEMFEFVVVGGREIRNHRPVMSSNNYTTAPSRVILINPVLSADALASTA